MIQTTVETSLKNYEQVSNTYEAVGITSVNKKTINKLMLIFPNFSELFSKNASHYLDHAHKHIWSSMFRHLFMQASKDQDMYRDITRWGMDSCAYFVSNVLAHHWLINEPSATISSLKNQLTQSQYREKKSRNNHINIPVWSVVFRWSNETNELFTSDKHVWFVTSHEEAISNSSYTQNIEKHPINGTTGALQPKYYFEKI